MISELYIRDFAIIDELRLALSPGFNVLTGETGAGKSIILDAMALVLGGRADTTFVRAGAGEAYVEATFVLPPAVQAAFADLLAEQGLEGEDDGVILLAREVRLNGRNICRINGRAVSLTVLSEIGDRLIDIHGQGEHLSLLKPRSHLPLLDSYAGLTGERAALGRQVSALRAVQRELSDLRRDERMLNQRIDLLKFQIEEINAANLKEGEEEELRNERIRLANVEQLMRYTNGAMALLTGLDNDTPAVTDMLGEVERAIMQVARLDPAKAALFERLEGLIDQINEVAGELRDYQDELEFNPKRLEYVEERLELLNHLKRKYGDDVPAIVGVRDAAVLELDRISHSEERIAELVAEEDRLLRCIGELGEVLSAKRKEAGERLAVAVERELNDLHMEGAHFAVDFVRVPAADGAYLTESLERVAFDQSGIDKVEFLVSANPGEPPKPLAKVASGGETSRLMLAMKTALAEVDETPTLIFDEIDQGIGGRVGDIVGRKLWGLSALGGHQVIVVTHLPQLAGYGDNHFHVSKHIAAGRTTTHVASLDVGGRVRELAAMLGTEERVAQGGAEAILNRVAAVKKAPAQTPLL
jgi:DNA repair protein RecN (Recombination protein N)